jgi:glycosyltransferase involved in cell wall biosynthesis
MPPIPPEISVIISAYNESLTVGGVISEIADVLNRLRKPYEIIVVDDGSTDLTNVVAEEAGAKVIVTSRNMGKGFALRNGFAHAKGDIIVTIDADGENNPNEIGKLLHHWRKELT